MKSFASLWILALALMALAPSARATLLIDTSGGTSLVSSISDPDDGTALRSLGGDFSLYGTTIDSIYVQADGFLSTADGSNLFVDRTVGELADSVPGTVIAPFFDDLFLSTDNGDTLTESVTSSYYAVSYAISGETDLAPGAESVFQAALIKSVTTIRGATFRAGDIVLSYGALNSTVQSASFTVGVAADSSDATGAFGVDTGEFATETSFTSNFDPTSQALLYRYNPATGEYFERLVNLQPTPEPSAFAALSLGVVAVLRRRRR